MARFNLNLSSSFFPLPGSASVVIFLKKEFTNVAECGELFRRIGDIIFRVFFFYTEYRYRTLFEISASQACVCYFQGILEMLQDIPCFLEQNLFTITFQVTKSWPKKNSPKPLLLRTHPDFFKALPLSATNPTTFSTAVQVYNN